MSDAGQGVQDWAFRHEGLGSRFASLALGVGVDAQQAVVVGGAGSCWCLSVLKRRCMYH
jgi:hypothetical protein